MISASPGKSLDNARRRSKKAAACLMGVEGFAEGAFQFFFMKSSNAAGGARSYVVAGLAWGPEVSGCSVLFFRSKVMRHTANKSRRASSPRCKSVGNQRVRFFFDLALPGLGVLGVAHLGLLGCLLPLD